MERILLVKVDGRFVPPPDMNDRGMRIFRKTCKDLMRLSSPTIPVEADSFYLNYQDARKRKVYIEAAAKYAKEGVKYSDSVTKCFIKVEKTFKADPSPRIISPTEPVYGLALGCFIRPIEHKIYRNIDKLWGCECIMKGRNLEDRGKIISTHWNSFKKPVAVGMDASRFDQSASRHLRVEHEVELSFFSGEERKLMAKLLKWQRDLRIRAQNSEGVVRVDLPGGKLRPVRRSGDMNTAMGNCLIMSMAVLAVVRATGTKCKFINDGDDGVLFMEEEDVDWFMQRVYLFADMGFRMVFEDPIRVLEQVVFCQCQPLNMGGGEYIMVRQLKTCLGKESVLTKKFESPTYFKTVLQAISSGGQSLNGGVPVFQALYKSLEQEGVTQAQLDKAMNDASLQLRFSSKYQGVEREYSEPNWETRYSFWLAFGVEPDVQVDLERYFSSLKQNYQFEDSVLPCPVTY
jgi:hypothetical protein